MLLDLDTTVLFISDLSSSGTEEDLWSLFTESSLRSRELLLLFIGDIDDACKNYNEMRSLTGLNVMLLMRKSDLFDICIWNEWLLTVVILEIMGRQDLIFLKYTNQLINSMLESQMFLYWSELFIISKANITTLIVFSQHWRLKCVVKFCSGYLPQLLKIENLLSAAGSQGN